MLTQGKSPRAALAATQRKADAVIREYNERVTG